MPSRLRVAAVLVALLAACRAGSAAAEESAAEAQLVRTEQQVSELAPDARPTSFSPYHSMRTEAFPSSAIELFGETVGFSLGRRLALFELEGGAALRLLDHARLTASFRMLSSDGDRESHSVGMLAQHLAAPYLGIALDF